MFKIARTDIKGWENLSADILQRIYKNHFGAHELTLAHVCSGWRVACCDPDIWNTTDLTHMRSRFIQTQTEPYVYVECRSDEEMTRILKLSMILTKGNTKTLVFHFNFFPDDDMITYALLRCPNLRRLVLPGSNRVKEAGCNALRFCKNLESLTMTSMTIEYKSVFESIAKNCKKFRELKVMDRIKLFFIKDLIKYLPKLKILSLRCTAIDGEALIAILDKMKSLEVLNICHSFIVDEGKTKYEWSEILEKASKLKQFVTCKNPENCVMCERTKEEKGFMRWYKYEEGTWKEDEVSSLRL